MNEDALIRWLVDRTSQRGGRRIGDDAAILPRGEWAVTMDSQIEGVHFMPGLDPAVIARRLLAVNLSDLAAMGARPAFAFLALAAPQGFDHQLFFSALTDACDDYELELAGGDLSSHSHVTAALTLLGAKPETRKWLSRSSARLGEKLWLGGTIGEAAVGLKLIEHGMTVNGQIPDHLNLPARLYRAARQAVRRQLEPKPQLELGEWLGSISNTAAIDLSDGLARDLHRLCSKSGVGAEVVLERLPLAPEFKDLTQGIGVDWKSLALAGGEDYVLLFSLPPTIEPPLRFGCTRIGAISGQEVILVDEEQKKDTLPAFGWDHLDPDE